MGTYINKYMLPKIKRPGPGVCNKFIFSDLHIYFTIRR